MRRYIRHPATIPIEFDVIDSDKHRSQMLSNVSMGGFAFASKSKIPVGERVMLRIPVVEPVFQAPCKVIWCRPEDGAYEVGLEFEEQEDAYRVRMVEQICHIEHYRKEVFDKEGRRLSAEEAALEWIRKYAKDFPHLEKEAHC